MKKKAALLRIALVFAIVGFVYIVSVYGRTLRFFVQRELASVSVLGIQSSNKEQLAIPDLQARLKNDFSQQVKNLETIILNISVSDIVSSIQKTQKIVQDASQVKDGVTAKIAEILDRY